MDLLVKVEVEVLVEVVMAAPALAAQLTVIPELIEPLSLEPGRG